VEEGEAAFAEKMGWKMWKQAMLHRGLMNMGNSSIKNWVVNSMLKTWTEHRGKMEFPKKSFN
jgi:L-lactate dehydrogenase complex protein LldF